MGRTIENIEVVDVEKRKLPSKHYVYIIHVTWSDGSTNVIYRRYSRFFDFQSQLMEMFPEEAGSLDPDKRIIPFLPGKKFFGRSHIREVAIKRLGPIAEYCKAIVKLPRKISQCKEVVEFFELDPDDISPPKEKKDTTNATKISNPKPLDVYVAVTDYKKQDKGEVTLKVGMLVEIVEKTETGWWFVNVEDEQGWVPSTCLEREDGMKEDTTIRFPPGEEEQYLCTEEFRADGEDEISMERGAVVDVIEKNLEGWWLVRYNGRQGFVPATFLMKTESFKIKKHDKGHKQPNKVVSSDTGLGTGGPQIIRNLQEISDLLKDDNETTKPTNVSMSTTAESDDDVFDDDSDYEHLDEDKIYSIHEISRILREDEPCNAETRAVVEGIQNLKSRSLKRNGSTRPPPRPSAKPSRGGLTPVTPRPPLVHSESVSHTYITIAAFSDAVGDGISFQAGQEVKVLEKSENGWWYISIDNREGWAPATYIESTGLVDKPRVQSSVATEKSRSPARSIEDLTNGDSEVKGSRHSGLGGLADILNAKFKSNKPPAPPKKDFLQDEETDIGNATGINRKQGPPPPPKKDFLQDEDSEIGNALGTNRKQGPPPPPKKDLYKECEDRVETPKAIPQINKILPTPPKKDYDSETSTVKPEPSKLKIPGGFALPGRKVVDRSSLAAPPPPPADRSNQPPPPPPPTQKPTDDHKGNGGFGVALKPAFPPKTDSKPKPPVPEKLDTKPTSPRQVLPSKHDIKPSESKPKLPPKQSDSEIEGQVNVSGIASALKAKFEFEKSQNVANKDKPLLTPKPAINHNKPAVGKRPISGNGVPVKPSNINRTSDAPAWAKNDKENPISRKSEPSPEETGAPKVSDLASVLKAKFESRQDPVGTATSPSGDNTSKPVVPLKSGFKPARPITPPSPKRLLPVSDASPEGRTMKPDRSTSPLARDSQLDPHKYSSRPLPPQPPGSADSNSSKPALPSRPKIKLTNDNSRESSDSDSESKPFGVSNLANVLKARLHDRGVIRENRESDSQANKPSTHVIPTQKANSDIENNNRTTNESDKLFRAIGDFAGSGESELKLVLGQQVTLLDKADGWWYVTDGHSDGWVPSTYLEQVTQEPEFQAGLQNKNKNQTLYRICSDFDAENEGELSVRVGQQVRVVDAAEGDWWCVEVGGEEGWIPANYVEQVGE